MTSPSSSPSLSAQLPGTHPVRAQCRLGAWLRRHPGLALAAAWLLLVALAALFPQGLAQHDPLASDPLAMQLAASRAHWLGTDHLGRDVLARVIHGARHSLAISAGALSLAVSAGSLLGLLAGLARGRWLDELLSRCIEVIAAFPALLLALLLIAYTGSGSGNLALVLGIAFTPHFVRLVRAQTFVVMASGYVEQARSFGLHPFTLVWRHVLPHALAQVPVLATLYLGIAITATAALSFLGMGPRPPAPEWGLMLAEGRSYLYSGWWISVWPGLAISLTVLAISAIGRYWQARFDGNGERP
jgi:peptide/nickel transport system permease protein